MAERRRSRARRRPLANLWEGPAERRFNATLTLALLAAPMLAMGLEEPYYANLASRPGFIRAHISAAPKRARMISAVSPSAAMRQP